MGLLGLRKVESFNLLQQSHQCGKKQNLGECLCFANWAASSRVGRTREELKWCCDFCAMAVRFAARVRVMITKLVIGHAKQVMYKVGRKQRQLRDCSMYTWKYM